MVQTFYLGTHKPGWLAHAGVPLFVSDRSLQPRRELPRAAAPWALDSGGFTQIALQGTYTDSPASYAARVRRYQTDIGQMTWAAIQDWMCEPAMLARTGKDIAKHQELTIASYLDLSAIAPDIPWAPVVQGWTVEDYLACVDQYDRAGVDLTRLPVVGVGSVCRRQATAEAGAIFGRLAAEGLRLHGFGVKVQGLARFGRHLHSADSLAWSFHARRQARVLCGATVEHRNCANCIRYALQWRHRVLTPGAPG